MLCSKLQCGWGGESKTPPGETIKKKKRAGLEVAHAPKGVPKEKRKQGEGGGISSQALKREKETMLPS